MKRENGFYWVRVKTWIRENLSLTIAEWEDDRWYLPGGFRGLEDSEVTIIGHKLKEPK